MRRLTGSAARGLVVTALSIFAATAVLTSGPTDARAAAVNLSLDNVTFDDGGTATGVFGLNSLGYLSAPFGIGTTAGTTIPGSISYIAGGPVGAPPAAEFTFNDAGYVDALVLQLAEPVGPDASGVIDLVPGGGDAVSGYTGSYEECVNNPIACGVASGTVRFIVAGDILVPEPASAALLVTGLLSLVAGRRRLT